MRSHSATLTLCSRKGFDDIQRIDNETGTMNGVAAVMPGRWGSHVGVMDLTLCTKRR